MVKLMMRINLFNSLFNYGSNFETYDIILYTCMEILVQKLYD